MRCGPVTLLGVAALMAGAPAAVAEQPSDDTRSFELQEMFALGIGEHRLDYETKLTGWRLSGYWYVGHREGDGDDALSLVWQGQRQQVSISTEGIRFTRHF